jgi:hypothetical protein
MITCALRNILPFYKLYYNTSLLAPVLSNADVATASAVIISDFRKLRITLLT